MKKTLAVDDVFLEPVEVRKLSVATDAKSVGIVVEETFEQLRLTL